MIQRRFNRRDTKLIKTDDTTFLMFYLFNKKNVISPKEAYRLLNSMSKGEKEILFAFIQKEIEIEQDKNSLKEV